MPSTDLLSLGKRTSWFWLNLDQVRDINNKNCLFGPTALGATVRVFVVRRTNKETSLLHETAWADPEFSRWWALHVWNADTCCVVTYYATGTAGTRGIRRIHEDPEL